MLEMETNYPWDGRIRLTVKASPAWPWGLSLRIPEWCNQYKASLNGREIAAQPDENGYFSAERQWQTGDVLALDLDIEPTFVIPHPRIDALRNCVALQRGPLIYCFEAHDQPEGVDLYDVRAVTSEPLAETAVSILGNNAIALKVSGQTTQSSWGEGLYRPLGQLPVVERRSVQLTAVPYFLWANRGMRSMRVWVPQATGRS